MDTNKLSLVQKGKINKESARNVLGPLNCPVGFVAGADVYLITVRNEMCKSYRNVFFQVRGAEEMGARLHEHRCTLKLSMLKAKFQRTKCTQQSVKITAIILSNYNGRHAVRI